MSQSLASRAARALARWAGLAARVLGAGRWAVLASAAFLLGQPGQAAGHETDQYSLPVGREFADLGPYLSGVIEGAIGEAVAQVNAAIGAALASGAAGTALNDLQSPQTIADEVWSQMFRAFPTNEMLDAELQSPQFRAGYPGLVTLHFPIPSIYDDPWLLIDFSKFVRTFFRVGTIGVGGTLMGTDKMLHFMHVGRIYHVRFEELRESGLGDEQAQAMAIATTSANPFYSEDGFLGLFTTGIRSNADLVADLAGLKFFRNLTEPVRIGDRTLPPMLAREGPYWRVQLEPGSQRFTAFVSPHWNEVLNPNSYLGYVAARVRVTIHERCAEVIDAYRDDRGRRRGRAQFAALHLSLSSYFGEPYDHRGQDHDPVTVSELCFDPPPQGSATGQPSAAADALGRSDLWWAARQGDADAVRQALAHGQNPDAADIDGETAVHAAVRSGEVTVLRQLLARGADPNAAALYGQSPLLLAAGLGRVPMAAALLDGGADPAKSGPFGRTPMHAAAAIDNAALAALLLRHGGDALAVDDLGNSAWHLAARAGHVSVLAALRRHGPVATSVNAAGDTPAAAASRAGQDRLLPLLGAERADATHPAAGLAGLAPALPSPLEAAAPARTESRDGTH